MTMVLFVKKGCEKCDFVKTNLPQNHDIKIIDIETPEGLSLLSWLSLVNTAQTMLPIYSEFERKQNEILPEVQQIIIGAINIKNHIFQENAQ